MDVLFCLALDRYLAGTGELGGCRSGGAKS